MAIKIKIRYENKIMTVEIPEEDFTIMIQRDYEDRLARAEDPASVFPRTPQEIMDERFNRPDYNNWQKMWRHTDSNAVPPRMDHKKGYLSRNEDDGFTPHQYSVDDFPDMTEPAAQERKENYEEMCALIRKVLKPDYADMVIAIHLDGLSVKGYAEQIGDKPNNITHRLKRAEKKLKEIFSKRHI